MSRNHKNGSTPPAFLSQNLLTSQRVIRRLVGRTNICRDDHVIEIGPGKGHITSVLAETCGRVTAVEIDPAMCSAIARRMAGVSNLSVVNQDFMQWRLPNHGAYKVFANIPFSITTAIVKKIAESQNPPDETWLVMEEAAARRFAGIPRESLRSLLLKPNYEVDIVCRLQRDDFHPRPSVNVVLFHMKKKSQPDVPTGQWRSYERFVTDGMTNTVALLRRVFTKKQLSIALKNAGMQGLPASEEMLYVQWLCLFRGYLAR